MNKRLNIYYWLRKIFVSKFLQIFLTQFLFINKTSIRKIVFFLIYKSNHWNKSILIDKNKLLVSGPGSIPGSIQTNNVVTNLNNFIKENNIKNILDMPCGDFAWIQDLLRINNTLDYTGYDIVEDIILINNEKYSSNNIRFFTKDIVNENDFDGFDLVFIRDFFIHISNEDILKVLYNIKNSKIKFFACLSNKNELSINMPNSIHCGQVMLTRAPNGGVRPRKSEEYVCWHVASNTFPDIHAAVILVAEEIAADSSAGNMNARPGAKRYGAADPSVCTRF
jgi:hypothetical protein